jgi:hypothetical protein
MLVHQNEGYYVVVQPYQYTVQFWQELIPLLMALGFGLYGLGQMVMTARDIFHEVRGY